MRSILRSATLLLMLGSICGCGISNLAVRQTPAQSPLRLEVAPLGGEVPLGTHVTVHVRLWNTSSTPVRNVEFAFTHSPALQPVGGMGSTRVHTDYGALHVERIARLESSGLAEWWLVMRAIAPGDANARALAVIDATGDASVETLHWQVAEATGGPDEMSSENDPVALARMYLALSQEHRARGRWRDELHALYAARVFIDQATPAQLADVTWADYADRVSELYLQEYGVGPAPLLQAALPRSSTLVGVVLDKASQTPLADATITLRSTLTDAIYATVTTNAEGAYEISDLGVEASVMVAALPGYRTTLRAGFEMCPNATTRLITELEPEPPLAPGYSGFGDLDLAELHGTLSGYRGDGTSDVEVMLVGADTRAVLTDENGEFRFTDVTPGDYTFVAMKPGFAAIELHALNVTPGGVVEVQFTLEPE